LCLCYHASFFSLRLRPPPSSTLFPYTTLFRSRRGSACRPGPAESLVVLHQRFGQLLFEDDPPHAGCRAKLRQQPRRMGDDDDLRDRKSTRLNSSHVEISYAVFCLKKKKKKQHH